MTSEASRSLTVKSLLLPLLMRPRITQYIKWIVYLSLIVNFGIYIYDDWIAYISAMASDALWFKVVEQFSTSIDMAAWLGLVFLFELETYALPDEAFKKGVAKAIHTARIICYLFVIYAAYGYTALALDNHKVTELVDLTELCQIADQGTAVQLDVVTYTQITSENCGTIPADTPFYQIADDISVIDGRALDHVQKLGWFDVVNAVAWLIVVLLIEIEVRMQWGDRFDNSTLKFVRYANTAFYGVLIFNAIIWLVTGYPVYVWDAFLWIFGFWAIELNLAEWQEERESKFIAAVQ